MSSRVKSLGRVAALAVGVGGFFGGVAVENYRNRFLQVKAAKPISRDNVGPVSPDSVDSAGWYGTPDVNKKMSRASEIMKFGFPGMENIRSFEDFVLSYDKRNRVPNWVFEHLTRQSCKASEGVDRGKCEFKEDVSVHPFFRAANSDYKGSGYDRGHMAAAGNHRSAQRLVEETFVLSNMCPQVGKGFNRDSWNRLEKYTRGLTKKYDNVYVCTGPLYLPRREENGKYYVKYEVLGKNNVAVPTHFFKVILGERKDSGQLDIESYLMPNKPIDDNAPLEAFRVPLESIERASGLLFFDRVPKSSFSFLNGRRLG